MENQPFQQKPISSVVASVASDAASVAALASCVVTSVGALTCTPSPLEIERQLLQPKLQQKKLPRAERFTLSLPAIISYRLPFITVPLLMQKMAKPITLPMFMMA